MERIIACRLASTEAEIGKVKATIKAMEDDIEKMKEEMKKELDGKEDTLTLEDDYDMEVINAPDTRNPNVSGGSEDTGKDLPAMKMSDLVAAIRGAMTLRHRRTRVFLHLHYESAYNPYDIPKDVGRLVFELYTHCLPKTAENFRALCTGEKGMGKNGKPLHLKGATFMGFNNIFTARGNGESVYGEPFDLENTKLSPSDIGDLYMVEDRKAGCSAVLPASCTSGFALLRMPMDNLNNCVGFGSLVDGVGVIYRLASIWNAGDRFSPDVHRLTIVDCGQIHVDEDEY